MNQKNNQRYKDNERAIENAFFTLLEIKPVNKISVRELCELSQINRSTFYHHYLDVYDLMDQIQMRIISEFLSTLPPKKTSDTLDPEYLIHTIRHISQYPVFYNEYLKARQDSDLPGSFPSLWKNYFVPQFQEYGITNELQMQYFLDFFYTGTLRVIRDWLAHGCPESPEELADIILVFLPTIKQL